MIHLKTPAEIAQIQAAAQVVVAVLLEVGRLIAPGISTLEIDRAARRVMREHGAISSALGYGSPPFPGAVCTSVDSEVVHGIPSAKRILAEGSVVSVDVACALNGWHADATRTFAVGTIEPETERLLRETEMSFWAGFAQARPGARTGDLSAAIQNHAEQCGFGVVRELTGHGIGRDLHEEPDLPNFGKAGHGPRLEPGMVFAMEPMINQGTRLVRILRDRWTIVTADGLPSAHYENTVAITEAGAQILTLLPGESIRHV